MQDHEHGRTLGRRSRHGKRLPQDPTDGATDSSGAPAADSSTDDTTTSLVPVTSTITVFVDPNGALTTPGTIPSSSPVAYVTITSTTLITPSSSPGPTSSATSNGSKANDNTSTGTSPGGMPVGTIVGVVSAILIILGAIGAFFFYRRRSMENRMKTRGWINNKNTAGPASSFLFLGDKEETSSRAFNPVAPFASPKVKPRSELSNDFTHPRPPPPTFNSYQPSNNGLPYVPPPAPPRPPPAHGYDNSNPSALPSPPTVSAPIPPSPKRASTDLRSSNYAQSRFIPSMTSASILSPLTPGTMPPMPTLPSPSPYPAADYSPMTFAQPTPLPSTSSSIPEIAKVVASFIPNLPDELSINVGETVRVKKEYDDGWALCVNAMGEQGMIPLECLERGRSRESKKLARKSSLAAKAYGGI